MEEELDKILQAHTVEIDNFHNGILEDDYQFVIKEILKLITHE